MKLVVGLVTVAALCSAGCPKDEDPAEYARKQAKESEPTEGRSEIIKIETPVAPGQKVACDKLFAASEFVTVLDPDAVPAEPAEAPPTPPPAKEGAEGAEVEDTGPKMVDKSITDREATSVCSFVRGGKAATSEEQAKAFEKNNMVLGVLPGDEFCLVTVYCSFVTGDDELRSKCEKAGDTIDDSLGQIACVHETQRAASYAYTYEVNDPDTKCSLKVMGGPSVTDEAMVQRCTRAALTSLEAGDIK